MPDREIKEITSGLEEQEGGVPGESWRGWRVIEVPSEWLRVDNWEDELAERLGLGHSYSGPGRQFTDVPHFLRDTYQTYHKERANVLVTQHGGLDV